jgi:hypothetical protein
MPSFIDFKDPQWITAISMGVMTLVLIWQLGGLSRQIKKACDLLALSREAQLRHETLEAVRRYETDPQLRTSIKHLYDKSIHGTDYSLLENSDRFHVITLLNFLDGIACGIQQGLLIEPLVKDYLHAVLDKNVRALLLGQDGPGWVTGNPLINPEEFDVLLNLHQRWVNRANASLYEMLR